MGKTSNNIVLIGFMGSGKTTIGKCFADRYQYTFLDTDEYIEQKAGMSIKDIFNTYGEEYFRTLETNCLKELIHTAKSSIISTGGGIPLREENQALLQQLGYVVYLKISKEVVLKRLAGDTKRPLLQGENVELKVEALLQQRDPIYSRVADQVICVDELSVFEVISAVKTCCIK